MGRVLLVDDDELVARAYVRVVRGAGYEVVSASNGAGALELLRSGGADVVVSDIGMPGMDGLGLLRAVREIDLDLPVILITAAPGLETAIHAVDQGAHRYLLKPVESERLLEEIGRAVILCRAARLKREALTQLGAQAPQLGDRLGITAKFDRALERLWIAHQPIVRWSAKQVIGFEALCRTDEPTLASPLDLLDAAERLGRLQDLGRALRARIAASLAEAPEGCLMFVNLHPHDLLDDALFDWAASVPTQRIVLEITERASLDQVSGLSARIDRLRELGFRLAVDDLGAGYAGLTTFTQLRPELAKLDMSLIRDVHLSDIKQRLVRTMIGLCGQLSVEHVVEGVETQLELETLLGLGCDVFQGYLFAKPARGFPPVVWPASAHAG